MRFHRLLFTLVFLCTMAGSVLQLDAQYRRRSINDPLEFTAAEQFELRQLMMQWIDASVVAQHYTPGIHCYNEFFITWHRAYIAQLEAYLMTQTNGPKYVPLPKWDPNDPLGIPNAFFNNLVLPGSAVDSGYTPLSNQNISPWPAFPDPSLCANYPPSTRNDVCTGLPFAATGYDNYALALESAHNPVHGAVGGVMSSFDSPASAIFFLWHAFIDDKGRYFQCACDNAKVKDLYMMDNVEDVGDEPNNTDPGGVYWQSPDIWVRQNQDPIVGGYYQHENDAYRHENPEYKLVGQNYVYVRIRNIGCDTVDAGEVQLRVYWSKASSGVWIWPDDWTNVPPFIPPHGLEITLAPIPVPALAPGRQWVAEVPWTVPDPSLYPLDPNHFCLLARLESVVDPMTFAEGPNVYTNTRNNNNIAWKNVMVYDTDPNNIVGPGDKDWDRFFFGFTDRASTTGRLRFDFPPNRAIRFTIDLGKELHDAWQAGGGAGTGVTAAGGTRVEITQPGASIDNIQGRYGTHYKPSVQRYLENSDEGGRPDVRYGDVVSVIITQYESTGADGDEEVVTGGLTYEMRARKLDATGGAPLIKDIRATRTTCPQGSDGAIDLTLTKPGDSHTFWWSNGAASEDVGGLAAGTYTVYVRNAAGVVDTREIAVGTASTLATEMDGTPSSCGRADGSARVGVTGGKLPYAFQWYKNGKAIQGATTSSLKNVAEANYSVVVTDGAGCSVTSAIRISDVMSMLSVSTTSHDASGPTTPDGSATAQAIGMMPPFRYLWSTGVTTANINGLLPGTYTVTVTDMTGCSVNAQVTIAYPQGQIQGVDPENTAATGRISSVVPNPASDRVDINYDLRHSGIVKIVLVDDLGRLVDVLYDGNRDVGAGSLGVDTRRYPSGRYVVQLTFDGRISAMPLVIVR